MESITLEKLANSLGGTPLGSLDSVITSLQDSKTCNKHSVCYIKDHKFSNSLSSNAGAVITTEEIAGKINSTKNFIIVDDPYRFRAISPRRRRHSLRNRGSRSSAGFVSKVGC